LEFFTNFLRIVLKVNWRLPWWDWKNWSGHHIFISRFNWCCQNFPYFQIFKYVCNVDSKWYGHKSIIGYLSTNFPLFMTTMAGAHKRGRVITMCTILEPHSKTFRISVLRYLTHIYLVLTSFLNQIALLLDM
jgi:hypothetical protein